MALRKLLNISGIAKIETEYGNFEQSGKDVAFNAYIKVEEVKVSKLDAIAFVSMTDEAKHLARTVSFVPSLEGKNFIAQAYDHLKTLPEFAGATDC